MMDYELIIPSTTDHFAKAKELILDYQKELDEDLCFQSFEKELTLLPKQYGPPTGGFVLLKNGSDYFACAGIRKIDQQVCELKRMYIHPSRRGKGLSKVLLDKLFTMAKQLGYQKMQLDTLPRLKAAIHLYHSNGFIEISAYYHNPIEGVQYFEKELN